MPESRERASEVAFFPLCAGAQGKDPLEFCEHRLAWHNLIRRKKGGTADEVCRVPVIQKMSVSAEPFPKTLNKHPLLQLCGTS